MAYQSLDAAGPEAPATRPVHPMQQRAQASKAMAEKRIAELEGSEPWRKANHPDHTKVMAELRRLYQQAHPSPVSEELPHVGELRRVTGTEGPRALPSHYAEKWNSDVEGEYLYLGQRAGIKGEALQAALNWYTQTGVLGGAFERGFTKEHETAFIEAAPSMGLSAEQAKGIVAWFREVEKDSR